MMEVDSLPFDDLAAAPSAGKTDPTFERKGTEFDSRCDRFLYPAERDYNQQYASMYFYRLEVLRPVLKEQIEKKGWLEGDVTLSDQLLRAPEDQTAVVIATIFKDMKLKPSILRDYKAGSGVEVVEALGNYCAEEDTIVLEDTSGRLTLAPNEVLRVDDVVTGVVCALKGKSTNGKFLLDEVLFPGLAPQPPLPAAQNDDQFLALVSGLQFGLNGAEAPNTLAFQMMVDYVTGHLGSSQEASHAASIVRLVVAGNSLAAIEPPAANSNRAKSGAAQDVTLAAQALDAAMLQLSSSLPVDIMAGPTDPAQLMMPQQPLHRTYASSVDSTPMFRMFQCLFPQSSRLKSMTAVTNPYDVTVSGVSVFGTAGQNIDDIWRYTKSEDASRGDLMANTLRWRHSAPTIPETLGCYPYKTTDPFIVESSPHVYFAGNQPEFGEQLLRDEDNDVTTRVIQVPSFAQTSTIVLVNLRTLECEPISFELV